MSYLLAHICKVLRVTLPNVPGVSDRTDKRFWCTSTKSGSVDFIGAQRFYVEYLKQHAQKWPENEGLCPIPTLEYMVMINEMFNRLLICRDERVTRDNIYDVKAYMKEHLEWFVGWEKNRDECIRNYNSNSKKNNGGHEIFEPTCLASVTITNLLSSVCGFLGFCEMCFKEVWVEEKNQNLYIGMLYSNQSSLESSFSSFRAQNQRDAKGFTAAKNNQNLFSEISENSKLGTLGKGGYGTDNHVIMNSYNNDKLKSVSSHRSKDLNETKQQDLLKSLLSSIVNPNVGSWKRHLCIVTILQCIDRRDVAVALSIDDISHCLVCDFLDWIANKSALGCSGIWKNIIYLNSPIWVQARAASLPVFKSVFDCLLDKNISNVESDALESLFITIITLIVKPALTLRTTKLDNTLFMLMHGTGREAYLSNLQKQEQVSLRSLFSIEIFKAVRAAGQEYVLQTLIFTSIMDAFVYFLKDDVLTERYALQHARVEIDEVTMLQEILSHLGWAICDTKKVIHETVNIAPAVQELAMTIVQGLCKPYGLSEANTYKSSLINGSLQAALDVDATSHVSVPNIVLDNRGGLSFPVECIHSFGKYIIAHVVDNLKVSALSAGDIKDTWNSLINDNGKCEALFNQCVIELKLIPEEVDAKLAEKARHVVFSHLRSKVFNSRAAAIPHYYMELFTARTLDKRNKMTIREVLK